MVVGEVLPALMAALQYHMKGPRPVPVPYPPYPSMDVARIPSWESIYPAAAISSWSAADESYNVRPPRVYSTDEILRSCGFPVMAGVN